MNAPVKFQVTKVEGPDFVMVNESGTRYLGCDILRDMDSPSWYLIDVMDESGDGPGYEDGSEINNDLSVGDCFGLDRPVAVGDFITIHDDWAEVHRG